MSRFAGAIPVNNNRFKAVPFSASVPKPPGARLAAPPPGASLAGAEPTEAPSPPPGATIASSPDVDPTVARPAPEPEPMVEWGGKPTRVADIVRVAERRGTTPDAIMRLGTPAGQFEARFADTVLGNTLTAAEQGLSSLATSGVGLLAKAGLAPEKLAENMRQDERRRREFRDLVESDRGVEAVLGERGGRIYKGASESLAQAGVAAPAGLPIMFSMYGAQGYENALEEVKDNPTLNGTGKVAYATMMGATEMLTAALMGKLAKNVGLQTAEEALTSPGMRNATKSIVEKLGLKGTWKTLAESALGTTSEGAEEALTNVLQQTVKVQSGVAEGMTLDQILDSAASGVLVGTAAHGYKAALNTAKEKLAKAEPVIKDTVAGVQAAEQAVQAASTATVPDESSMNAKQRRAARKGREKAAQHQEDKRQARRDEAKSREGVGGSLGRGAKHAGSFFERATPEDLEALSKGVNRKQFEQITGIKKTSKVFRDSFTDTLRLYEKSDPVAAAELERRETAEQLAAAESEPAVPGATVGAKASAKEPSEFQDPKYNQASAKRRIVDRKRAIMGLDTVPTPETQQWSELLQTARTNKLPQRAIPLATEIVANPRALSPVETAGMVMAAADLQVKHEEAMRAVKSLSDPGDIRTARVELDRMEQDFDVMTSALRTSGTEKGRALAAQKMVINQDYSLLGLVNRAKTVKGDDLSARERARLETVAQELQDIRDQRTALEDKLKRVQSDPARRAEIEDVLEKLDYREHKAKVDARWRIDGMRPKTIGEKLKSPFDFSRAILTSWDLSGIGRQGGVLALGHPIIATRAAKLMAKAAVSPRASYRINKAIFDRPQAWQYEKAGLDLHQDDPQLGAREEAFSSRFAEKIPGVAGSQRAYTTFLNQLRADSFDLLVNTLSRNGQPTADEMRAIANWVNVSTGRGNLGQQAKAADLLSTVFFAPRYLVSRFQLYAGQPLWNTGSGRARKLIAQEYGRYLMGIGSIISLAVLFGADVELDPRSADFLKIRVGDRTRIDPVSGLSQAGKLIGRMVTGQKMNPEGRVMDIRGEDVRFGHSAFDEGARFLRQKLSPLAGTAVDVVSGRDMRNEPVSAMSVIGKNVVPMSTGEMTKIFKEHGMTEGSALGLLNTLGVTVSVYD